MARFDRRVLLFVIVALTVAVYLPVLRNDWQAGWDDAEAFLFNENFRGLGWANLKWMWTTHRMGAWHPLTWMSLGIDHTVWGMNPVGYHLTNVLLHSASAGLVYIIARRLLGDEGLLSAMVAFAWAWHPLRVESVAWASERKDVLCGFFYLAAVLAYLRDRYWTTLGLFALALLSKPMAVSLPAVLLILDAWRGRLWPPSDYLVPIPTPSGHVVGVTITTYWFSFRRLFAQAPFSLLALLSSLWTYYTVRQVSLMPTLTDLGIRDRILLSIDAIGFYLWKTIWPVPLLPMYQLPGVIYLLAPGYLASYAAVLGITGGAIALRRRYPAFLAAWAASVVILLPVLNLMQNGPQAAADRYTYLSSIPLMLFVGGAIQHWLMKEQR